MDKPANKPRYKPQGREVRYRRSKAVARRRLLTAIRDSQVCRDPIGGSQETSPTESAPPESHHAQRLP